MNNALTIRTRLTAYTYHVLRRLRRRRFSLRLIVLGAALALITFLTVFAGDNDDGIPASRLSVSLRHRKIQSEDPLDWLQEDDNDTIPSIKDTSHRTNQLLRRVLNNFPASRLRSSSTQHRDLSEQHKYAPNGLLEINPLGPHPIFELLESAEKKWQEKLSRSSRTLRDAVTEYQRRYHRMPPKGFDKWWNFVVEHDVQLPDEYDRINQDMSPFWGMKHGALQELQLELQDKMDTFTIGIEDHMASVVDYNFQPGEYERSGTMRAFEQLDQLEALEKWLPDFNATFSMDDAPHQFIDYEMRMGLVERGMGEEDQPDEGFDEAHLGWASACPPFSPLRSEDPHQKLNVSVLWEQPKSFIHDHKLSMDPCLHPTHAHLNGMLNNYGIGPRPNPSLHPIFSLCSSPLHSDILTVATEGWTDDPGDDPVWEDKTEERLLWRGTNTGAVFIEKNDWDLTQRVRLIDIANRKEGTLDVIRSPSIPEDLPGPRRPVDLKWMNDEFMDIGFVDRAIQCDEKICETIERDLAFKERKAQEEANLHKYILDIDGNGWSARFKRLMTTKSLVLKTTIFPEWYTDRVQPWVHYVPVKNDLTDLYDIMTFFRGNPGGDGTHDSIAKTIAMQGRAWSLTFWRRVDMDAYMFRLFLEFARVLSQDRESQTFTWDDLLTVEKEAPERLI
ncbi:Glycosyltransferase Family 90 domain containing protein [Tulasnella sp. 331]|nr:Glycosyltransferase Family 90 domain containing protein [Tulasnella sp. 331]